MHISITEAEIKAHLQHYYNMPVVQLNQMDGYDSLNYKVKFQDQKYVLKIYNSKQHHEADVAAENEILTEVNIDGIEFPKPVKSISGQWLQRIKGSDIYFRLLTFLEGTFLGEIEHSDELIDSLGTMLGRLDHELAKLTSPVLQGRVLAWDLGRFLDNTPLLSFIKSPTDAKLVAYFIQQFKLEVQPKLPSLRASIIHNDANEWNVLSKDDQVSGLIDFGDMIYTKVVFEIAICAAYLGMQKEDPLSAITRLVAAYHKTFPLEEKEIELLYYCIAARLCTSVLNSAKEKEHRADASYITISEKGAWHLLRQWIQINPEHATNEWKKECDFATANTNCDLMTRREKVIPKVFSLSYREPIHMTKAAFQYMYDAAGNTILDAYNNIIQVGHAHPTVVAAGQDAMAKLNTNTRYLYESLVTYSEQLLAHFPAPLSKVFFVNSGSAASDLAIRLARTYTGRNKIAVLQHGYHGNTQLGIDISHYKYGHKGGKGKHPDIIELALPDTYRHGDRNGDLGAVYAKEAAAHLTKVASSSSRDLAAFICEPIVGCGGQVPLAPGYLQALYPEIRSRGGLCISDEVQVGFGRLGTHFWGFEYHGVTPDIVVLGKPIGNGHPMAAVVTTEAIADSFNNGMEFFSSFGGNPVSSAVGKAVLDVLESESLQTNALETGDYLKRKLHELMSVHECIGDVRGEGLFIGIDLVTSRISKEPDAKMAKKVVEELKMAHILTSIDGPGHNVIKIKPPLCFNRENVDHLRHHLDKILFC